MTKKTKALLEQALKLSAAEREELMTGLAESLEGEDHLRALPRVA